MSFNYFTALVKFEHGGIVYLRINISVFEDQ